MERETCRLRSCGAKNTAVGCWARTGGADEAGTCCGGQQVMSMLAFGGYEVFREGREMWEIDAKRRDRGNFQEGKMERGGTMRLYVIDVG